MPIPSEGLGTPFGMKLYRADAQLPAGAASSSLEALYVERPRRYLSRQGLGIPLGSVGLVGR